MKLYHNGLSTCSQKVRLVLAEKNLAFDSVVMDLQGGDQFKEDYLRIHPKAVVPALEDEGCHYIESSLINEYLDDAYPAVPLKPTDASARYRMRTLIRKIDELQHPACSVITYAIGLRPILLNRDPAELQRLVDSVPDQARRENRRAVMAQGIKAPVFHEALFTYMDILREAEALLAEGEWLAGSSYSLADCALLPYVLRLEHLGQKSAIDQLPRLARWYTAVQARPAYRSGVHDWLPEAAVNAFRAGGEAVAEDLAALF